MDICIILRVFNRMSDLEVNLQAIRRGWTRHRYHVLVVSNGTGAGHRVPDAVRSQADEVVELADNPGHRAGSARMLREGVVRIPAACRYAVLLEADTWILSDAVVDRAVRRLEAGSAVWASAEWIGRYWTLALDFAVARSDMLRAQAAALFDFDAHAEAHVCEFLLDHGLPFFYIREAMPVHCPGAMRRWWPELHPGGRFRSFPGAGMVTHHLEDLPGGIEEKRRLANVCLGEEFFPALRAPQTAREHRRLCWLMRLAGWFPQSRWVRGKKRRSGAA